MKVLVVDNYDSFTFNLVQYLGELGADPVVVRNDVLGPEEMRKDIPAGLLMHPLFAQAAYQIRHPEAEPDSAEVFLAAPHPYLGEDMTATLQLWLEEGEVPQSTPEWAQVQKTTVAAQGWWRR